VKFAHVIQDSGIDTVITIPQLGGRLKDLPLKIIDLLQLQQMCPPGVSELITSECARLSGE